MSEVPGFAQACEFQRSPISSPGEISPWLDILKSESEVKVAQSCLTPWTIQSGVGCHSLLQGIFPTQESNQGLLHCRRILYKLSYQESPDTLNIPPTTQRAFWAKNPFQYNKHSSHLRRRHLIVKLAAKPSSHCFCSVVFVEPICRCKLALLLLPFERQTGLLSHQNQLFFPHLPSSDIPWH